ncbi:MAG: hypothetical protein LUC91_11055 [Prevotella sp.]|nr:hypothetical protein [Prevotella sp.]
MTYILLIICFLLVIQKWYRFIPVILIVSLWINPDVRAGSISVIGYLYLFIAAYIYFFKNGTLTFDTPIDKNVSWFIWYFIIISIPFALLSTGLPFLQQIMATKTIIFNLVILVLWKSKISYSYLHKTRYWIYLAIVILCAYGIYTYITHTNPFIDYISDYCSKDNLQYLADAAMSNSRGALSGRITGVSLYTIQYGILMAIYFYLAFAFSTLFNERKVFVFILLLLIFSNVYLTGSRGPIGALILAVTLYYMRTSSLSQYIKYSIVILIVLAVFSNYLEEFFYIFTHSRNVTGSSFEMRSAQFLGALSIVKDDYQSLLFGKGFGYTTQYLLMHGKYTSVINFESSHVSGLVTYGLLGMIFIFLFKYIMLWCIVYKANKCKLLIKEHCTLLYTYVVMNFIYSILVGQVYELIYTFVFFLILKMCIISKQLKSESYSIKPVLS